MIKGLTLALLTVLPSLAIAHDAVVGLGYSSQKDAYVSYHKIATMPDSSQPFGYYGSLWVGIHKEQKTEQWDTFDSNTTTTAGPTGSTQTSKTERTEETEVIGNDSRQCTNPGRGNKEGCDLPVREITTITEITTVTNNVDSNTITTVTNVHEFFTQGTEEIDSHLGFNLGINYQLTNVIHPYVGLGYIRDEYNANIGALAIWDDYGFELQFNTVDKEVALGFNMRF